MDARNSRFIPAFEHFWNGWASARKDILLIICGSATSWIINKLFRNKGGLYNRVTFRIKLQQFSLNECEELVNYLKLPLNRNMIVEGYMVMGGVPYYWTKLEARMSMGKNINNLSLKKMESCIASSTIFIPPCSTVRINILLSWKHFPIKIRIDPR